MLGLPSLSVLIPAAMSGGIIAWIAYRRFATPPVSDVRAEVRAEEESTRSAIEALAARIEGARRALMPAAQTAGSTGSDGVRQWLREIDLDLSEAELLRAHLPAANLNYEGLSDMDVEVRLVEILALSSRAGTLADKYRDSISLPSTEHELPHDDSGAHQLELARPPEVAHLPRAARLPEVADLPVAAKLPAAALLRDVDDRAIHLPDAKIRIEPSQYSRNDAPSIRESAA